jgi:hypothetical protein
VYRSSTTATTHHVRVFSQDRGPSVLLHVVSLIQCDAVVVGGPKMPHMALVMWRGSSPESGFPLAKCLLFVVPHTSKQQHCRIILYGQVSGRYIQS